MEAHMNANEWMSKGYMDGWRGKGPYAPPNHPIARAAYDHGWRSADADNGSPRTETITETREAAYAIIAADALDA